MFSLSFIAMVPTVYKDSVITFGAGLFELSIGLNIFAFFFV